MANKVDDNSNFSFQAFLTEAHKEFEQIQRELKEIDILIKQNSAEVERAAQRSNQLTNYVRQLQVNFDTIPRQDIKEGYEELLHAQQRLFSMRGSLEKLQSDQRNLERLVKFQRRLLELTEGMAELPTTKKGQRRDRSDVVRVIQTEESARQSLVRKMHDGPASSLSNFILQAEICQRLFDVNADRARAELNGLKASAASTFETVKDFIFDLRPMMLDDLGVVPTLRRHVESLQEKSKVPVSITVTGIERRLAGHVEVTIFRSVQELLNNARKHARANQIQVMLDLAPDRVLAVVEDNGSGFNLDDVMNNANRSLGLSTLRERVEMLGGQVNIQSSLGQGTRAEIEIPIETEAVVAG